MRQPFGQQQQNTRAKQKVYGPSSEHHTIPI